MCFFVWFQFFFQQSSPLSHWKPVSGGSVHSPGIGVHAEGPASRESSDQGWGVGPGRFYTSLKRSQQPVCLPPKNFWANFGLIDFGSSFERRLVSGLEKRGGKLAVRFRVPG